MILNICATIYTFCCGSRLNHFSFHFIRKLKHSSSYSLQRSLKLWATVSRMDPKVSSFTSESHRNEPLVFNELNKKILNKKCLNKKKNIKVLKTFCQIRLVWVCACSVFLSVWFSWFSDGSSRWGSCRAHSWDPFPSSCPRRLSPWILAAQHLLERESTSVHNFIALLYGKQIFMPTVAERLN